MPGSSEIIVLNSGPLIAFNRIGAIEVLSRLPLTFVIPKQIEDELLAGSKIGYPFDFPVGIKIQTLSRSIDPLYSGLLDRGEAAVVQLALENGFSVVAIDEIRGRKVAATAGLAVTGSLGLLGRAKQCGIIAALRPLLNDCLRVGIFFDRRLIDGFLERCGE